MWLCGGFASLGGRAGWRVRDVQGAPSVVVDVASDGERRREELFGGCEW
jgi:hypothetical protein